MRSTLKSALLGFICAAGLVGPVRADVTSIRTPPAGSNSSVQYNNRGQFGGDSNLTYSTTTLTLTTPNIGATNFIWGGIQYAPPPTAIGGYFLTNDGAGNTSWAAPTAVAITTGGALGVLDGTSMVSPQTSSMTFNAAQFVISLQGTTTAAIALNPSSVTVMGPLSASAPIVLTGSTFSLDKSSATLLGPDPAVFGAITGTLSATVLSTVDISGKTNLAVSAPVTLTGDTVGVDKSSVTLLGPSIEAAELPANGYASTYVNTSGDSMTGQLTVNGSSITATYNISGGSLTARNLSNTLVAVNASGVLISTTVTSGGTPGGADTNVQFNNAGSFGGSANMTWDNTNSALTVSSGIYTYLYVGDPANGGPGGSSRSILLSAGGLGTNDYTYVEHAHCLFGTCTSVWRAGTYDSSLNYAVYDVTNSTTIFRVESGTGKRTSIWGARGLYVRYGVTAGSVTVVDDAYAAGWNGSSEVPTKNAVYDKIETLGGGGGSSSLQVTRSGVQVTSPTASINFYSGDFLASAAGTTAQILLNPATTNYIWNSSLQQTATFYVTSGTVAGDFATQYQDQRLTMSATSYAIFGGAVTEKDQYLYHTRSGADGFENFIIGTSSMSFASNPRYEADGGGGYFKTTADGDTYITMLASAGGGSFYVKVGGFPSSQLQLDVNGSTLVSPDAQSAVGVTNTATYITAPILNVSGNGGVDIDYGMIVGSVTTGPISASSMTITGTKVELAVIGSTDNIHFNYLSVKTTGYLEAGALTAAKNTFIYHQAPKDGFSSTAYSSGLIIVASTSPATSNPTYTASGGGFTEAFSAGDAYIRLRPTYGGGLDGSALITLSTHTLIGGTLTGGVGAFNTSLTVGGSNVCRADGTNCPASGGGGGSSLAVTTGTSAGFTPPAISSPTLVLLADASVLTVALQGSATAFLSVNYSSITAQGPAPLLSQSSATATYAPRIENAVTYLTLSSATATYAPRIELAATYLTQSSATATYLQLSSATAKYLQNSSATVTYLNVAQGLTQSSATATYLQLSSATLTYAPRAENALTYLTLSSATATYAPRIELAATYLTQSSATATYLQNSSATATYFNRANLIDISANTNLAVTAPVTLTGDTVGFSNTVAQVETFTSSITVTSTFTVSNTSIFQSSNTHISIVGSPPVLSSCGASPTVTGSDTSFTITGGAGSTGCTATFAQVYVNTPTCVISEQTPSLVNALVYTVSNSALTLTQTAFGTSKVDVMCFAHD